MTGGYHTRRQRDRDRTLADRAAAEPGAPSADGDTRTPVAPPRACWIRWPDPSGGYVLAWQRDEHGRWWALVTAALPQEAVEPRAEPDVP